MGTPFARTRRTLSWEQRGAWMGVLLVGILLLVLWSAWLVTSRVTLYAVSSAARLEADGALFAVQAPVGGRIIAHHLTLGANVAAGDVLVELDAEREMLELAEAREHLRGIEGQLEPLRAEIAVAEEALAERSRLAGSRRAEERARLRAVEEKARFAGEEASRIRSLAGQGYSAELEAMRLEAEARREQAGVDSQRLSLERLEREERVKESEQRQHLQSLRRTLATLEGQRATSVAMIDRLEHEVDLRRIRAPSSGRIEEVSPLQVGMQVAGSDRLATIISESKLRVVAELPPDAALGRVRPGQRARLRLEGFPWTEYGSIHGRVVAVAGEVRRGTVRVELSVERHTEGLLLGHGLPGRVDIELERVSPAVLLLRAAGALLDSGPTKRHDGATQPG